MACVRSIQPCGVRIISGQGEYQRCVTRVGQRQRGIASSAIITLGGRRAGVVADEIKHLAGTVG